MPAFFVIPFLGGVFCSFGWHSPSPTGSWERSRDGGQGEFSRGTLRAPPRWWLMSLGP